MENLCWLYWPKQGMFQKYSYPLSHIEKFHMIQAFVIHGHLLYIYKDFDARASIEEKLPSWPKKQTINTVSRPSEWIC